jgi:chorismate mutase
MVTRGVRGAITVTENNEKQILSATTELLNTIVDLNQIQAKDIASVFITVTTDLNATFPARAIRYIEGWELVPLMCSQELDVPNSLPMCIRLMILTNTVKEQHEMQHVYLREAVRLRPDIATNQH